MEDRATPKTVSWFSSNIFGTEKKKKKKKEVSQKLEPVRVMVKTDSTTAKFMETSEKPVKYSSSLWPSIFEPFVHWLCPFR